MDTPSLLEAFGLSALLGLFVGLQRQSVRSRLAGVRTFPIITLFGTATAWLAVRHGGWVLAGGIVGVAAIVWMGNMIRVASPEEEPDPGTTTEFAILLMFAVGALLVEGPTVVAVALGGAVAILLHLKPSLHRYVADLESKDISAIMQFVLISCIILPILPNRTFGPFEAFNPFMTWLMVVLIVGIGLSGYIAYKLFGHRAGILAGGFLGGLVSSTATTVGYARRAASQPELARSAALVVLIASTVVYARVLIEVAVTAPFFVAHVAPAAVVLAGLTIGPALLLWRRRSDAGDEKPAMKNPSELTAAITFAVLYAAVRFSLAASREYFGTSSLYVVAVLAGLTDLDAVTLSTSRMVTRQELDPGHGANLIVVGLISNMVFKVGIVATLGGRALLWRLGLLLLIPITGAALLLAFPPARWVPWTSPPPVEGNAHSSAPGAIGVGTFATTPPELATGTTRAQFLKRSRNRSS